MAAQFLQRPFMHREIRDRYKVVNKEKECLEKDRKIDWFAQIVWQVFVERRHGESLMDWSCGAWPLG